MMDKNHIGILVLIKSGLTGRAYPLPEGFSLEECEQLIVKHQVGGMVYEGAVLCGISKTEPVMQRFFQKYYQQIIKSEKQMAILEKMFTCFDENGIDYLPVKGVNMKKLYPNPAMRAMGDADVLIRVSQYDRIKPLMVQMGFTEGPEVDYELVWEKGALHLELHKQLLHSRNTDYFKYFGQGWEHALPAQGHRYTYTNERMFVFILGHFAKHYRDGGIGLRQAIDLWIYAQKVPMDQKVLAGELEKAKMLEFYTNIRNLLESWFGDRPLDEKSEYISQYLFTSGSWGAKEQKIIAQGLRESKQKGSVGKVRSTIIREAIFPPLNTMRKRYPVLRKAPILLPVYWPVRWVGAALSRHDNIRSYARNLEISSVEQIDSFEKSLQYVGLSFDL